jgi:hypothetical protein
MGRRYVMVLASSARDKTGETQNEDIEREKKAYLELRDRIWNLNTP